MGAAIYPITETFESVRCYKCQAPFYMSTSKYDRCKEKGDEFYCPNGHSQVFTTNRIKELEAEVEKQKKFKEWAQQDADNQRKRAARNERKARAYKGVITKTKKRVGKGVCPCCNRFFQKLHDHMKTKHPTYSVVKK